MDIIITERQVKLIMESSPTARLRRRLFDKNFLQDFLDYDMKILVIGIMLENLLEMFVILWQSKLLIILQNKQEKNYHQKNLIIFIIIVLITLVSTLKLFTKKNVRNM